MSKQAVKDKVIMKHSGEVFVPDAPVSQRMANTYVTALKEALAEK